MKVSISGVRGIYGDNDLGILEVIKFTKSFSHLVKSGKCTVARDTRPSGRILSESVSSALMTSGIDVFDLGVAPTPAAFRQARRTGAAVIVTASHNPLEWNGLKFVLEGRGLFESELESMLARGETEDDGKNFGKSYDDYSSYVEDIAALTTSGNSTATSVAVDSGGGAACGYAEQLFKKISSKLLTINSVQEVSSRGPDPTVDDLLDLRGLVVSNHLDLGFALDLDADRLVVVSSSGEKLNPDATLLLSIVRSIELGMRKFVTSIDTSVAIEQYIKNHGGMISHSKVGEANVVSKMLEVGAEAGGEGSSAGFIMPSFNMCRDGLLAAATICTLDKKSAADALDFASQFLQIRSKVPADSALHKRVIDKLPSLLGKDAAEVLTLDGVKAILDDKSWVLVRPSNTEHAIRVSVESTRERAPEIYKWASEKVTQVYDQIK